MHIFFLLLTAFVIQPISAGLSDGFFTMESRAARLCKAHGGPAVTGIDMVVCVDRKAFNYFTVTK